MFALQRNEDGNSLDKRFVAPRRTIDNEVLDSEDHMPIAHAGPRHVEYEPAAAKTSGPAAAEASGRERRAVPKRAAEKDLPKTVKRKKTASRGPNPKPLIAGVALTATQSQTCITSEIPAAPSPHAEAATQATGETEIAVDPTSSVRDVGPSVDASNVASAGTSATGTLAAGTAPSSAATETLTEPQATETAQQPAMGPQEPQGPQPTPTAPSSPPQPEATQLAAAKAK
ncbi:predicted GPI-anchored protein 58 [Brachypodium distachyon]|uniref:predicted GPI-anchored protein 58 n=1 Tax=Brachypodium distachyon TaxID=15368 RepID=UPI00052FF3AE|nr:predicted GPI-anchored protein 58 [Brachypodium distachyon]|eukprot:XP_010236351.1 predicted GPI-anchored protein 58 [Brachypodium distachyon]